MEKIKSKLFATVCLHVCVSFIKKVCLKAKGKWTDQLGIVLNFLMAKISP